MEAAQVLFSFVREHAGDLDEARIFVACPEALEEDLYGVRIMLGLAGAPHRSGHQQQQADEHPDAVQAVPRLLARDGSPLGPLSRWEDGIPRVAHGIPSRVDRLRGLGNAVVPQVAEFVGRCVVAHAEMVIRERREAGRGE